MIIETIYIINGEELAYTCYNTEFEDACCSSGKFNPGYYHIESLESQTGFECETECCKPGPIQCGNGKLENGEECDDGNTKIGDGCGKRCQVECGWTCTQSTCTKN